MLKKVIASVALAGAVVSVSPGILSPITAFAGPPEGAATLSVAGGTGATAFNISLPAAASCSGNGAANYRWETFIASSSIDVGTLIFTDGPNQPAGTFTSSLTDTFGEIVKQKFPGAAGFISGIPQMNFSSLVGSGITAGTFKVGVFCANLNAGGTVGRLDAGHYWETLITVTNPATMAWSFGAAPAAPVLGALTGALSSFTGSFTSAAATPAVGANGYVVTAVPTAGTGFPGATVTQSFSATGAFTFSTPLSNATTYSVTMTAANAAGTSPVSNTQTVLVNPPVCGAVSGLSGAGAPNSVVLNWTAPVACPGATLASYTVTSPTAPGSPFKVAAGTTTLTVGGLTPGTGYAFSVIGDYNAPFFGTASNSVLVVVPKPGSLVPLAAPGRVFDTRKPGGSTVDGLHAAVGRVAANSVYELPVAGRADVPSNAASVVLNVTVVSPADGGFLTVFPCGQAPPNASNLNFAAGTTIPNSVLARVGVGGKVCFFTSAATDILVDVSGYFPAP